MLLATQVWTYWFGVPLLAGWALAVVASAIAYYRRVALPGYMARHQRQAEPAAPPAPREPVRPLPRSRPAVERPRAA